MLYPGIASPSHISRNLVLCYFCCEAWLQCTVTLTKAAVKPALCLSSSLNNNLALRRNAPVHLRQLYSDSYASLLHSLTPTRPTSTFNVCKRNVSPSNTCRSHARIYLFTRENEKGDGHFIPEPAFFSVHPQSAHTPAGSHNEDDCLGEVARPGRRTVLNLAATS